MIVKKIFNNVFDDEVHNDFVKFSRGEFKDRYLIEVKKQASKWNIKTSSEFANSLVKFCLSKITAPVQIKGIIVSTLDLTSELDFPIEKTSNFQGIRKIQVNTEIKPQSILNLMKKYPKVFFALTFSGNSFDLKIKPKAPKSGKPGNSSDDEDLKIDFCNLKTEDDNIVSELFFDTGIKFKEAQIKHLIKVTDIVYPANMKEMSPSEIRAKSKRKGIIVRQSDIDGVKKTSQAEFVA